jgi:hypothetical protein
MSNAQLSFSAEKRAEVNAKKSAAQKGKPKNPESIAKMKATMALKKAIKLETHHA